MELELLRLILVVLGTSIGAYTDFRTGFIYDWITYPMIAIGILLNLLEGNYLGIGIGIGIFIFGYALYWFGKMGGGDVKLFAGIASILPLYQGEFFILNVILTSSLLAAVIIPMYYIIKYMKIGIPWTENKKGIQKATLFAVLIGAYFTIIYYLGYINLEWIGKMSLLIGIILIFIAFEEGIKSTFFKKKVELEKLGEDEIIADEKIASELGMTGKRILGKEEIQKLKVKGYTAVSIYTGLPKFGPFILLGVLISIQYPDLLYSILIPR